MNPEAWQRVGKLLDDLLELSDPQREQALQRLRQDEPTLCQEVESLLEYRQLTARLQAPPPDLLAAAVGETGHETIPPSPHDEAAAKLPEIAGYEVLELLARGGMGVVYRARHRTLGHEVALKMILSGEHAGPEERARFQLEAAAVAKMRHAGIVHIHDFGEHGGNPYFSLEFLPGGSLAQRLRRQGRLPMREAAALVEKLARAVQHAHDNGIVHRDLKPANVLLTADGEPKIADFGLAKQLNRKDGLSQTGNVLGTPDYMAPEQASGSIRAIGPGTDVYALGAILYVCLSGQVPFHGTTTLETLSLVLNQDPTPLRRLVAGMSRDLETICLRCLEKEPGRRYQSAADLAADLGRFLRGEPVAARPVGTLGRGWRWCRRNPGVAALLTLVLVVLTAGTAVSTYFALDAAQQAAQAKRRAAEAREETDKATKARDFLVSIFRISEKDVQAGNITARQILDQAEERVPREFADQLALRADLLASIKEVKRNLLRAIPVAMILEARGSIELRSPRTPSQKPKPQMLLHLDDRLSLGADAEVQIVFLSDLHRERLEPAREVTIGENGCTPAEAIRGRDHDSLMTFVRLPKGTFYMGGGGGKAGTKTEIAADFEIAVHPVTQGQWQAIMGNNPSWFSRRGGGAGLLHDISDEELKLFPVENVSWENAQQFIKQLNEKESASGFLYRLPTSAEWEYACRAGATTEKECSYHFYFDQPTNDLSSEQANFNGTLPFGNAPKGKYLERTTRVGAYPPNQLGLCDMHGNVWQLCAEVGVARGGSWNFPGGACVASMHVTPTESLRVNIQGFRLVRVPVRSIPAAMILEAAGNIQLHSPRSDNRRPVPQTLLYHGDRLTLGRDAHVRLIHLSDEHQERLKPAREVTVGRKGCEPADAVGERNDDILMPFVRLPKGTFYMGGGGGERGEPRKKTEIPEDFEIAIYTVTQGQWQALMGVNPSACSCRGTFKSKVAGISDGELKLHPVENVSWEEAQEFIKKLNEKERSKGYRYRLPTEAEWEYACRAGATSEKDCSWHFYLAQPTNDLSSEQANFKGSDPFGNAPKGKWLQRTTRVGAYPPNPLGLCDMHGNVFQWCADLYQEGKSARVVRGGCWMLPGIVCIAGFRGHEEPSKRVAYIGFRLVRVPDRAAP